MQNVFLDKMSENLISTLTAFIVIVLTYIIVDLLVTRKFDSDRKKKRFRARSFYVACIVLLFFVTRIWVEGFTHLLAVLGLVSAALVVTNKESIMNVVGWLIITWRGLFAEGDLIQILDYKGYVKSIGILYFSLLEISDGFNGNVSGKIIRVPNGLVANNALLNFSQTSHLLERKFTIVVTQDSDIDLATVFLIDTVTKILHNFYKGKKEFTIDYLYKQNKHLKNKINLTPTVSIQPKLDKPIGIELITRYYCFASDLEIIQQNIWTTLLKSIKNKPKIKLSYA